MLDTTYSLITITIFAGIALVFLLLYFSAKKAIHDLKSLLERKEQELKKHLEIIEPLRKYQKIVDIEAEVETIKDKVKDFHTRKLEEIETARKKAEDFINQSHQKGKEHLKEAKEKAKEIKEKAENKLHEAHLIAKEIESNARKAAEDIAGDAFEAKEKADQYTATVQPGFPAYS